jgi:hypothetical protein
MTMPPWATNKYTTEQLLELALVMLDNARREQNDERMSIINEWLTDHFAPEIIRAKVGSPMKPAISAKYRDPNCAGTHNDYW